MEMTPKEYNEILYCDLMLKIEGFQNRRRDDEYRLRKVGFSAYVAPHLNPKKMAKKEDAYWPIDTNKAGEKAVGDDKRARIAAALKKQREKNGKA